MALSALRRGNTRKITLTITDKTSGLPINLTGLTVILTVARTYQQAPLIQITNTSHVDAANGKTEFTILEAQSKLLTLVETADIEKNEARFYVDATLINASAQPTTVFLDWLPVKEPVRIVP